MTTEQPPPTPEAEIDAQRPIPRGVNAVGVYGAEGTRESGAFRVIASRASRHELRLLPRAVSQAEHLSVKGQLHQRLLDEINERGLLGADEAELEAEVRSFVDRVLATEDIPLNEHERRRLADDLLEETLGVGPLAR